MGFDWSAFFLGGLCSLILTCSFLAAYIVALVLKENKPEPK